MDPRLSIIDERLASAKRLIPVVSGKGGVGKSMISSTLSLVLSEQGHEVGLLDLDLHGPSSHTILGADDLKPREEKGVVPPEHFGIEIMSIVYYTGNNPSLLRGVDVSNAIMELLTITRWGPLDFLIIDMPPGIGNETLDVIRFMKRAEFLVVTTPSKVAFETVKKLLMVLKELNVKIAGVVENMKRGESSLVKTGVNELEVPLLGGIDFDEDLENSIGSADKLLDTQFARSTEKISKHLV